MLLLVITFSLCFACAIGVLIAIALFWEYDGYYALCTKITDPKNNKHFFKRIRWFKKILRGNYCVNTITEHVLEVRILQTKSKYDPKNYGHQHPWDWKARAAEVWQLSEYRQLFTPKELKVIDKTNAQIDAVVGKLVKDYEKKMAKAEAREAERKAREAAEEQARAQRVAEKSQRFKSAHANLPKKKSSNSARKISLPGCTITIYP